MATLPKEVAREFCTACNWAFYCCTYHRALFHSNPREEELAHTAAGHALGRLSLITHEYGLLQILKLHDKPKLGKSTNLGIAYVIERGGWSASTRSKLESLQKQLNAFGKDVLGAARNKAICHNDLDAILAGDPFGGFPDGDDLKYFEALQAFVNIVWLEIANADFPFDEAGRPAGRALVDAIRPGSELPRALRHEIPR